MFCSPPPARLGLGSRLLHYWVRHKDETSGISRSAPRPPRPRHIERIIDIMKPLRWRVRDTLLAQWYRRNYRADARAKYLRLPEQTPVLTPCTRSSNAASRTGGRRLNPFSAAPPRRTDSSTLSARRQFNTTWDSTTTGYRWDGRCCTWTWRAPWCAKRPAFDSCAPPIG